VGLRTIVPSPCRTSENYSGPGNGLLSVTGAAILTTQRLDRVEAVALVWNNVEAVSLLMGTVSGVKAEERS
jgi:hypothetical protein